jgi:hypothetical protein
LVEYRYTAKPATFDGRPLKPAEAIIESGAKFAQPGLSITSAGRTTGSELSAECPAVVRRGRPPEIDRFAL